jgi:hypothetical protein
MRRRSGDGDTVRKAAAQQNAERPEISGRVDCSMHDLEDLHFKAIDNFIEVHGQITQ